MAQSACNIVVLYKLLIACTYVGSAISTTYTQIVDRDLTPYASFTQEYFPIGLNPPTTLCAVLCVESAACEMFKVHDTGCVLLGANMNEGQPSDIDIEESDVLYLANEGPCLGSDCLVLVNDRKNFSEAREHCAGLGAHLMDIHSEAENTLAKDMARDSGENLLIGATDMAVEGEWHWVTTGELIDVSEFEDFRPSNSYGQEDCVVLRHNQYDWNDIRCDIEFDFICEF